jgi:predicted nucleic acid-binding Zn ribbon protein
MKDIIKDNVSVTNRVTTSLRNSHCIICGKPFNTERMGKLYCSSKCKQFGFNHKEKINQSLILNKTGINTKPQTFYIDEFQFYDKRQKMLKRYKELSKKKSEWELAENEIINCKRVDMQASNYTWQNFISKKLTENEEGELYELETEIEDEIKSSNLKELSIEQWSFIRSLYPSLDKISFCELVTSFSKDFYSQLNLNATSLNKNENVIIQNKYINHCNLFADGLIKLEVKPEYNESKD